MNAVGFQLHGFKQLDTGDPLQDEVGRAVVVVDRHADQPQAGGQNVITSSQSDNDCLQQVNHPDWLVSTTFWSRDDFL